MIPLGFMPSGHSKPKSLNRPQHERLYRMVKMLVDGGFPNCTDFCAEFEVNRRTILRDLDYLRDRMRIPLEFDRTRNGYYLTQPIEDFPLIEIQESDLLMLFVAQRVAAQCGDAALAGRLKESFERLSSVLGDTILTSWSQLDSLLTFRTSGVAPAEIKAFETLQKCARDLKAASFLYKGHKDSRAKRRTVHPYQLGLINNQWYLFAWDPSRKAMRTFALARMQKIKSTDDQFTRNSSISIPDLLSEGMGVVYMPNESIEIRIRFAPNLATVIAERKWHASQKIAPAMDGSLELCLRVPDTNELRNWILSWGPSAEVLVPQSLRETIARIARETASLYAS